MAPNWLGSKLHEVPIQSVVFLYFTGEVAIGMTALPFVTYAVCRDLLPNMTAEFCLHINEHPDEQYEIQKVSATYLMVEKMLGVIPPLLLAAFFGPWSDRHGRKLPLLLPFFGLIVAAALFLMAFSLRQAPSVSLFIMGGFLARALSGHFILLHLVSVSHVADVLRAASRYREVDLGLERHSLARSRAEASQRLLLGTRSTSVPGSAEGSRGSYESLTASRTELFDTSSSLPGRPNRKWTSALAGSSDRKSSVGRSAGPRQSGSAESSGSHGREGARESSWAVTALDGADLVLGEEDDVVGSLYCAQQAERPRPEGGSGVLSRSRGSSVEMTGSFASGIRGVTQTQFMGSMARLQVSESLGIVAGALSGWGLQLAGGVPLAFGFGVICLLVGMIVIICLMKDYRRPLDEGSGRHGDLESSALKRCTRNISKVLGCGRIAVDPVVMWGCFFTLFFVFACREGRGTLTPVYIQRPPLAWPNALFSLYIAAYSLSQSIFLFFLAPVLAAHTVVVLCLVCTIVGGLWMGFAESTWAFMLAGCLSHMADCVFPALRAILCRGLNQRHVGAALARLSAAEALATIAGPVAMVIFYNLTSDFFPGLAYVSSAALPAMVLVVGAAVQGCCVARRTIKECKSQGAGAKTSRRREFSPLDTRRGSADPEFPVSRDASQRPDFTQSLNVPSATASGYGLFWCSAEW